MIDRYLLDTCAVIWLANGAPLGRDANMVLSENRARSGALVISPMSAWEIGMLVSKGRLPTAKNAAAWFNDARKMIGADIMDISQSALIEASFLPQPIHNDPTDRILIATARENDLTIITRDRTILAYGDAGHVRTLAC